MTARDEQVLRAISEGRTAKEAAHYLNISEHAVEYHLLSARKSLGARNTVEAVSLFIQRKRTRKALLDKRPSDIQTLLLDGK